MPTPPKLYLYVSDEKLNRLYPEIPLSLKEKFAGELSLSLNLGVVGGSLKSVVQPHEDRISRLKILIKYLEESGYVAEIDTATTSSFFKGTLLMKWGRVRSSKEGELVFFTGSTERTLVGLAGQSKHTLFPTSPIANHPDSTIHFWLSSFPAILRHLEGIPQSALQVPQEKFIPEVSADEHALKVIESAIRSIEREGVSQRVEFLAVNYLYGGVPHPSFHPNQSWLLFGSPLYVAQV